MHKDCLKLFYCRWEQTFYCVYWWVRSVFLSLMEGLFMYKLWKMTTLKRSPCKCSRTSQVTHKHVVRRFDNSCQRVVGYTTIYVISTHHHWHCEFESHSGAEYSIQHLCDNVCQWLVTGRWFSLGTPVSSTNKTDRHDITEILLTVALNTITHNTNPIYQSEKI